MSSSDTLLCQNKIYSIEHIKTKHQIFTDNATYSHNNIPRDIPESHIYQKEDTEEIVTVVKNIQQEVELVTISNKILSETISLTMISPKYPRIFAEVKESDYDYDELNRKFRYDESEEHNYIDRHLSNLFQTPNKERNAEETCSSYKVVELAVAYESSFCKHYGGKEGANQRVAKIIAGVNNLYKNHVCMKVRLSHLEGYCDSNIDPYKQYVDMHLSGCDHESLVHYVGDYWNENRRNIHRDAMHLFSGTKLDGKIVGCALKQTICNLAGAYGVSHITFTESESLQAGLVAHELGHNLGASHYEDESGYIMYGDIGIGSKGFSDESLNAIRFALSRTTCIHDESQPTPSPTPPMISNETKYCRFFVDITDINPPQTSVNVDSMVDVMKDATNAAINNEDINMSFRDYKLEKKEKESSDKLYNFNFAVQSNMPCAGSCDIVNKTKETIKNDFEKNFDEEMKKAADIYEVTHLFRHAYVDVTTSVYTSKAITTTSPSPTPKQTFYPTRIWKNPTPSLCRNKIQSLINLFLPK